MTAAARWADALAAWAIPDEVLAAAPESPWGFPTGVFAAAASDALTRPRTATHERALEALPPGGAVLDVGAGGGATSLPLADHAGRIVAVDASATMLDELRTLAAGAVELELIEGRWPDVATSVGTADVAVCGHVAYNVEPLDDFVVALTDHATHRVVLELTAEHPQSPLSPLWQHFWGIVRPTQPTADTAIDVIEEAVGVTVSSQRWRRRGPLSGRSDAETVAWARRRLCLPPSADDEIAELLGPDPRLAPTDVVTLWWPGRAIR